MLADERAVLERQADRQYASLEKLLERGLWVLGGLGALALSILYWFFGKTKSEAKAVVREIFEEKVQEAVEREVAMLKEQYQALRSEVEDLASFKNRRVVWVVSAAAIEENDLLQPSFDRATAVLFGAGVSNISQLVTRRGEPFDVGDPDLVVLSFDGSVEARRDLGVVVGQLQAKAPPVPLLIYTFNPGQPQVRLEDVDIDLLGNFDWYVPVNFPAQLVAQVQVLLRRARSSISEQ